MFIFDKNSKSENFADNKIQIAVSPTIMAGVLVCCVVFQISLLPYFGNVGFAVFGLALTLSWGLIYGKRVFHIIPTILLLTSLFLAAGMVWRANEFIQAIFKFAFFIMQILLYIFYVWENFNQTIPQAIQLAFKSIYKPIRQTSALLTASRNSGKQGVVYSWIKTAAILLAVLFFFSLLLYQSDPIFAQMLEDVNIWDIIVRIIWFGISGMFLSAIWTTPKDKKGNEQLNLSFFSLRDLTITMFGLVILFGVFLSIQWQYLFAGTKDMLVELNLTLSEYVRKGFLELLGVVFFGSILVYLNAIKIRQGQYNPKIRWLKIVTGIGIVELFLLLGSAFKRDLMYVESYGLTRMRIIGEVYLVWLACMLLLLAAFVFLRSFKEKMIFNCMLLISLGAVVFFTFFNMDKYLLASAPGHHNYTDYYYLTNLSADAGEELFSVIIPKMQQEAKVLMQKTVLTDVEKYQLAGIKLAFLSLRVQRNDAFMQSATIEDIWIRNLQLGHNFIESTNNNNKYNIRGVRNVNMVGVNVFETPFDRAASLNANTLNTSQIVPGTVFPDYVLKRRSWQNIPISQRRFNNYVLSHPELFNIIDTEIINIRRYQMVNNITLTSEESMILYELKYPMMRLKFRESDDLHNIREDFNNHNQYPPK